MKRIVFLVLGITICSLIKGNAQEKRPISMSEVMEMAYLNALDAFKSKRQYVSSYWEYRSFQAQLLPKIDLSLQPFTFNRSFIQRYDPINNIDVFRQQRNLNTFGQVSLSQNVMITGATIFINSSFNRFVNFSDNDILQSYNTTPIRIGINQPIMAFNELKWQNQTAELEYKRARKEYLLRREELNIKTIELFFNWALAKNGLQIAEENKKTNSRLYEIGKKKYPLGTIQKDDLLTLELETFTANTDLVKAKQEFQEVISELQIFLEIEDVELFFPELPEVISGIKIDIAEAYELARKNNPELINLDILDINAARDLDRVLKENRFSLSVNASYGLNQQSEEFSNAYSNFLDQQMVSIQFRMPLLDWGEGKGNIQKAKMDKELADIQNEQTKNEIQQLLKQNVNSFNLQKDLVAVALRAREIAQESYKITEKRFLTGKVDLLRLLSARRLWHKSSQDYIQSLWNYWKFYYSVRKMTLYDFIDRTTLEESFEQLLKD